MDTIINFLGREEFSWLPSYGLTFFATAVMYMFSLHKGFKGATEFLYKVFPDKRNVFYARVDFILVIIIGSVIGYIVFSPNTPIQSLAAGFGWIGAMNTLVADSGNISNAEIDGFTKS